jgi:hypothetical protein
MDREGKEHIIIISNSVFTLALSQRERGLLIKIIFPRGGGG